MKKTTADVWHKESVDKPQVYNIWTFNSRDTRLGEQHEGNIPGQIMLNLLYYYTTKDDLVIDPMAGGGSTIDACLVMGRKCRAYDIKGDSKKGIEERDLVKDGFAKETKNSQLVFLDPPYWKQKKGSYTEQETDLSNMPLEKFYTSMNNIFKGAYGILKKGGYIAVIISPTQEKGVIYDHAIKFYEMLLKVGFTFVNRIIVPYTTQQVKAFDITDARKGKYMLKLYRDLLIFKKK